MRVLIDYHHADLAHSFALTLGDRFGWEIYHPYGMEWFDQWYWSFEREWHGDRVARQYLEGIWDGAEVDDATGVAIQDDPRHANRTIWGVPLETALAMDWDIVISSVPGNAAGFSKFAEKVGAKWGIHVGNQWGEEAWQKRPAFAILSTTSPVPDGIPHVVVHQEFSLEDFRYEPPVGFGPVRSFVNCFPETPEYVHFLQTARSAPDDITLEVFGALGSAQPDEFTREDVHGTARIGDLMRESGAIWHAKHWSDGFGHVIHNAFAVGRPVIGYERYYADKLAGPLWLDGVTSIDVEKHSKSEIWEILRRMKREPHWHEEWCRDAAERFREVVDFDADAAAILDLLTR